jgi:hypothetical protein
MKNLETPTLTVTAEELLNILADTFPGATTADCLRVVQEIKNLRDPS